MRIRPTLLLAYLLLMAHAAMSQKLISGTISDDRHTALVGVNIQVKGTDIGTISDLDGNYQLAIPGDFETLIYSYIGYATVEEVVGNREVINVLMTEETSFLNEIVRDSVPH